MRQPYSSTIWLVTLAGCAAANGPAPAPASAPAPAPASASTPASAPASTPAAPLGPLPTGGAVLVGEIVAPPSFDPGPTLEATKPQLLSCYNQSRQTDASLRGKLKVRITINEAGTVLRVDAEPGGSANAPALVSCIDDALRAVRFPKPGGTASLLVPLVFRP